jgi:hypothetical protein
VELEEEEEERKLNLKNDIRAVVVNSVDGGTC